MLHTRRRRRGNRGFTLIETMIAITVLAVGMLAMAALLSNLNVSTDKSRYISTASLLASEKLEQLNRYPVKDPAIAVTGGASAGSLTADVSTDTVDYFDEVLVSSGGSGTQNDGLIAETTTGKDATGNTTYTTITQSPNGEVKATTSTTPPSLTGTLTYKRRWLVEKDTPVVGVCRVTVAVTLENVPKASALNFQMSMVRQYAN